MRDVAAATDCMAKAQGVLNAASEQAVSSYRVLVAEVVSTPGATSQAVAKARRDVAMVGTAMASVTRATRAWLSALDHSITAVEPSRQVRRQAGGS